jgi:hypothetical protein
MSISRCARGTRSVVVICAARGDAGAYRNYSEMRFAYKERALMEIELGYFETPGVIELRDHIGTHQGGRRDHQTDVSREP